jgi:hypothetical protein
VASNLSAPISSSEKRKGAAEAAASTACNGVFTPSEFLAQKKAGSAAGSGMA